MTRMIDGDKLVENLRLIATCWSISPFVSKEKHNGAVNMLREVEREVKEASTLTPLNEWVSVEERLPEYNPGTGAKSYWVAKKDNAGNWQMKIAQYCDYGYAMTMDAKTEVTWRDWDFTKIANVTHWMLLPEPPDRRPPEEDT